MSQRTASDSVSWLMLALILVGIFGYAQPWIVAPSGAMTLNAFDLAEWASLTPAQRGASPPLVAPLLLRLQPVILSSLLGLIAAGRKGMALSALAICMLAAAQLPPFEFVYDINNLNYRQQFFLATGSLAAGAFLLRLQSRRLTGFIMAALAVVGIVTAALGLATAASLYGDFGMDAAHGAGIWLLCLSYAAQFTIALRQLWNALGTGI